MDERMTDTETQENLLLSKVSVVLPSLDPDQKLLTVIDGMLTVGFSDIILVNDGSDSEHLHYFEDAVKRHPEVTLLHHPRNFGKGAALKTAFQYFLLNRPEFAGVVTVDGDNQHTPSDTKACVLRMLESKSVILGARNFNLPGVPARSKKGNHITSAVFKYFCGMRLSDTQTGLRAIPRDYLQTFLEIKGDRFEYETNMLLAMKRENIPYEEVKIHTVYIEENKSSHFRAVRDSFRIYRLIFAYFLHYSASSLLCAAVDTGLYAFFTKLFASTMQSNFITLEATVGARAISSLLNFFLNKKLVFHQKGSTVRAFLRYYLLVIVQMGVQTLLSDFLYIRLGITVSETGIRTLLYVLVMVILFVVNYFIQEKWVFAQSKKQKNASDKR